MTRQEALQRVSNRAVSVLDWFKRIPVKAQLKAKDWQEAKEQGQEQPALFILQERHQDVLDFYTNFENLVEILCDAAQRGATAKLQTRYTEERNWMQTHYYLVRPYLAAYLTLDADDAELSLLLDGMAGDDSRYHESYEKVAK